MVPVELVNGRVAIPDFSDPSSGGGESEYSMEMGNLLPARLGCRPGDGDGLQPACFEVVLGLSYCDHYCR